MSNFATTDRVGIVGIGAMGLPMARNLRRRGIAPYVRDVDPARVALAVADGLLPCESAEALGHACDLAFVVVVDAAQIDDVLFGEAGIARAWARAGGVRKTVVLCSTIAAEDTERIQAGLAPRGIDVVDAPISGGPARAESGEMSMMVAAARDVFDRLEPLLRRMASALHYVGERVGDAARTKLVNNLLAAINLAAGAEALALGVKLGLDRRKLFDVIAASSGASWVFLDRMARALDGDFAPRARTSILTKDVTLALRTAAAAGIATPLGREALAVFRAAVDAGLGDEDDASIIKTFLPDF